VVDDDGNTVTWLVVTALKDTEAWPVSYVSGSCPDANNVARIMADDAGSFDCAHDFPTVNSKVGEPGISFASCSEIANE